MELAVVFSNVQNEVEELLKEKKKKLTYNDICHYLSIQDKNRKRELNEVLNYLIAEGIILETRKGYSLIDKKSNIIVGELRIIKSGNGYIDKYFVDKKNIGNANNGDTVAIELMYPDGKERGIVRNVLKRSNRYLIYTVDNGRLIPYKHSFSSRLKYDHKLLEGLSNGDRVGIKVSTTPKGVEYEVTDFIFVSKKEDPNIDYKTIAANNGFDYNYTKEELEEVNSMPTYVSKDEICGRRDFRDEFVITIDGEKTKDMDDAISCRRVGENYEVKVHLSDVAHYIKKGSHLYERAKKNTTSLYLMNEVFYMLHPLIANGICSLNENVDRLTLSVIITLSSLGEVIDYKIEESVINSKKKTSYEKCNKYLDEGIVEEGYEEVLDTLDLSKEISDKIDEIRCRRGFLPFSSNEIDFDTDPDGKVISINNRISGSSEKIIENFMLLADYCYADYMIRMYQTIIRRVHDAPKKEKIKEAISTIKSLGYKIRPIKDYSDQHALKK